MTPERWRELAPWLEQALAIDESQRSAWLAELAKKDPVLARDLGSLLASEQALQAEGFLEQGPRVAPELLVPGESIGAYRLIEPVGYGGMGTVWLAERSDGRFDRRVAVKFPNMTLSGRAEERFRLEGAIVGRLSHPNIAQLLDAGVSQGGRLFLVLEYVEGEPIDLYCDERRLGVHARLRLFLDVLAAVAHAHANLVVHRDLKPSNVLVTPAGEVKLLDFGVAKLLGEDLLQGTGSSALTRDTGVALTPEYASPEQLTGAPVTTATDIYALGVLLFRLLCGRHPGGATGSSPAALMEAVLQRDPVRPSETISAALPGDLTAVDVAFARGSTPDKLRRALQGDLDTIILKTLKKSPADRYPSVTALAADLRRVLAHMPISVRPDSGWYIVGKFVRRNRLAVSLALVIFVAVVGGVIATLVQAHAAREQRDFAWRQLARAEAINELNLFVLSDAAPAGERFTAGELLQRAEQIVARQPDREDATRTDLLVSIGLQYWRLDEVQAALRVLEEAYERSAEQGDSSLFARAACMLASTLASGEDLPRAERLYQEGLSRLPARPEYLHDRVFCLQRGAEVAREADAFQAAIVRGEEALRLAERSPLWSELMRLRLLMSLAESHRYAYELHRASDLFAEAWDVLQALGRDGTDQAATLLNNWGVTLSQLGRPLESEMALRRAIAIGVDESGEDAVSPMLLVNYARAMRLSGRPLEAADYARRGHDKGQVVGYQTVMQQANLELARALLDAGELDGAVVALDGAEAIIRRNLPEGHLAYAALAMERAMIAERTLGSGAGLALFEPVVARVEAMVVARDVQPDYLARVTLRRAELHTVAGDLLAAQADGNRAGTLWEENSPAGARSCLTGRAWLVSGQASVALGAATEALEALEKAEVHLSATLPENHPEVLALRALVEALTHRR